MRNQQIFVYFVRILINVQLNLFIKALVQLNNKVHTSGQTVIWYFENQT